MMSLLRSGDLRGKVGFVCIFKVKIQAYREKKKEKKIIKALTENYLHQYFFLAKKK